MPSDLILIPGIEGRFSIGTALAIRKRNGKDSLVYLRDRRFSPHLLGYEAEWLLRNEVGADQRARLYASRRVR